jgi:hypothetical protein
MWIASLPLNPWNKSRSRRRARRQKYRTLNSESRKVKDRSPKQASLLLRNPVIPSAFDRAYFHTTLGRPDYNSSGWTRKIGTFCRICSTECNPLLLTPRFSPIHAVVSCFAALINPQLQLGAGCVQSLCEPLQRFPVGQRRSTRWGKPLHEAVDTKFPLPHLAEARC